MRPWEEQVLAKGNWTEQAVSTTTWRHNGRDIKVDVIKPRKGDAWICYKDTAVKICKAPAALVDSLTNWRPWSR